MAPDESVVALLHLSAVVAVLSVAFVGVDKAENEPDTLKNGLEAAKPVAHKVLLRLGLTGGVSISLLGSDKWRISTLFPAGVICIVGDKPLELGRVLGKMHIVYRQRHIPLFGFFKNRKHLRWIGMMATISVLIFFGLVADLVWRWDWPVLAFDGWILKALYFVLVTFSLCIFGVSGIARLLRPERLTKVCGNLEELINRRFQKLRNRYERELDKLQRTLQALDGIDETEDRAKPP